MAVIVVYILETMTPRLFPLRGIVFAFFLVLLPLGAAAADNWIEVRSAHFTVCSNASEREARKVAGQFEQIRTMFHTAFSTLRVDPAQPIIILAVKNENTLKLFLPEEYELKGHIHHTGMYQPGEDKDYVVLRLDSEGENPFHTLYHEYTHALMRLNFRSLPIWLNEGLAEFFGNSTLGDKEIKTGTIDPGHLYLLNQSKLISIETLLEVDHNSPYYNEKNRASVFYAESWAVVHYLMMDPEARQKQLLKNFLSAWEKSDDQIAAAREAFGDLKRFGQNIESYARQASFHIGLVKVGQEASDKNYTSRSVSAGEALALRGDFYTHHNRIDQAQPTLEEAVRTAPNLPFAHEALGFYHFRKHEIAEADKEMIEAMKLGATDFLPPFFHGVLLMQREGSDSETAQEAQTSLEKAVQVNPQFAPAFESLAQAYSHSPESQKQAVNAAIKAVQLEPATLSYSINLTYLLVTSHRLLEARTMAQRILAAATSPGEKEIANNLLRNVQQAEEWVAKKPNDDAVLTSQSDTTSANSTTSTGPARTAKSKTLEEAPVPLKHRTYGVDGPISSVDCSKQPEVTINVNLSNGPVRFHATDFGKVSLSWADGAAEPTLSNCTQWKGRKVKVWFSPTPGMEYAGEITKLFFF